MTYKEGHIWIFTHMHGFNWFISQIALTKIYNKLYIIILIQVKKHFENLPGLNVW